MTPSKPAAAMTSRELAAYIDYAILKPEFSEQQIRSYVAEAVELGCRTVCVNPAALPLVAPLVEGTETDLCCVCDFPFGQSTPKAKAAQAKIYAEEFPLLELDMVANFGKLVDGDLAYVTEDIRGVVEACHAHGVAVKVIIESDALTLEQVADGTRCAANSGADFIKSSTGFYTGGPQHGATVEVVRAMIDAAEGRIKVKGSGGIRTQEHFFELIDMGMDRAGVGCTSAAKLVAKQ